MWSFIKWIVIIVSFFFQRGTKYYSVHIFGCWCKICSWCELVTCDCCQGSLWGRIFEHVCPSTGTLASYCMMCFWLMPRPRQWQRHFHSTQNLVLSATKKNSSLAQNIHMFFSILESVVSPVCRWCLSKSSCNCVTAREVPVTRATVLLKSHLQPCWSQHQALKKRILEEYCICKQRPKSPSF